MLKNSSHPHPECQPGKTEGDSSACSTSRGMNLQYLMGRLQIEAFSIDHSSGH